MTLEQCASLAVLKLRKCRKTLGGAELGCVVLSVVRWSEDAGDVS